MISIKTNNCGSESLASNLIAFIGLIATVYVIVIFPGPWKSAGLHEGVSQLVDNTDSLSMSTGEFSVNIYGIKSGANNSSSAASELVDDLALYTQTALHVTPCDIENKFSDDRFMRIELPADKSCAIRMKSKTVEL